MNPLRALSEHGTSLWLDNLTRDMIADGTLEGLVRDRGLRGVTSNPAIFHKAIAGSDIYDEAIRDAALEGRTAAAIVEELMLDDIRSACDILRPVYDGSEGADGFVSLEVSPFLVHDTDGTVTEVRRLFAAVDRPNVLIKIPGSPAGVPAIEEMLTEGVNVNITLLFSVESYEAVAMAYLRALERRVAAGHAIDRVASVASFFLSRIDVLVDRLLGQRILPGATSSGRPRPEQLLGRTAIANARIAYQRFRRLFSGERWSALEARGARVQRVLWASTSTKNPLYDDVRYVEALIGPHTVNTMPDATIEAFADHGQVRPGTVEEDLDEARRVLGWLGEVGIDLDRATAQLLDEGMDKFTAPYDALVTAVERQRAAAVGAAAAQPAIANLELDDVLDALDERRFSARLHARDTSLWSADPEVAATIATRLGWLDGGAQFRFDVDDMVRFSTEVRESGIDTVLLMGMGGSSLWPKVAAAVWGPSQGAPNLVVLDSTDPEAVDATAARLDPERTLFVVASKSGTTTETLSFYRHFFKRLEDLDGVAPGERFVAITDPGSPLAEEAKERGFRRVFANPEDIGGRYSALSFFGLVPMALLGRDLGVLLDRAAAQLASCAPELPASASSGVLLGAALGVAARRGRDKVTLLLDDAIAPFGRWLEQLLAESTGKNGVGLIPVIDEPWREAGDYGDDRVFVALGMAADADRDRRLDALEEAGHPVVRIELGDPDDLAAEVVRWEVATATAGAVLGINPFDEPNVAQALGDFRALADRGRPVVRVDLGEDPERGLDELQARLERAGR